MRPTVAAAVAWSALLVLPWTALGAAPAGKGSQQAAALLAQADAAFADLKANTSLQRRRDSFSRVLESYRRVFEKYPATRPGEQALMRAGELLTLLYRWTGQEADLNQAQNYYQRLAQSAPRSPLADDALLAIAYLYLDQLKDPAQAWQRFRDVTTLAPEGDKVAEAKRQLKRLAQHARAQPPAPADDLDLSCPAPAGGSTAAASPTVPVQAGAATQPSAPSRLPGPPPAVAPPTAPVSRVRDIRHWSNPEYSRVVIDLDRKTNFYSNLLEDRSGGGKPPRLYVDLFSSVVEERLCKPISVNDGILIGIRAGQYTPDSARIVLEIDGLRTYRVFPMHDPYRIVVDITGGVPSTASSSVADTAPDGVEAPPPPVSIPELLALPPLPAPEVTVSVAATAPALAPASAPAAAGSVVAAPAPASAPSGSGAKKERKVPVPTATPPAAGPLPPAPSPRNGGAPRLPPPPKTGEKLSLARQLGLGVRRIVIDAGHGAHDPGAIGVGGLQEKDVTLDLALRVRDLLEEAGYATVLTRDRDVYLPLEERTALANTTRGDLFLSLHCNSSDAGNLNGVETYYLNLASSRRAMATAARENSMAVANMSDLQDLLKEIYNSKMDESSQFAAAVQRSLASALRRKYPDVKDLGVKQAPFYVLIGAQMPSVLAEVSFINHRSEGRRLADPRYRQILAQALADGVKRYVKTAKTAALAVAPVHTP